MWGCWDGSGPTVCCKHSARFLQASELEGALRVMVQFLHFIIENSEERQSATLHLCSEEVGSFPGPCLRVSLSSLASELLGKGGCQPLCNGEVNGMMKTHRISAKVIALMGMLCQQISSAKNLMIDDPQK